MAAAIFGLIGVLVGGVLSFASTVYLQRRQDRSTLRAVGRLAYDDFLHFQSTLVRALAAEHWWRPGEVITPQVDADDRKFLLGQLGDEASQDVAAAIGWAAYLTQRRDHSGQHRPSDAEFRTMRDTFCRLDLARRQLSGEITGRHFRSFADGAVLNSLDRELTLEDLGIGDGSCLKRRRQHYGREAEP